MLNEGWEELLVAHWEEVANNKDIIPLKPDWLKYRALERNRMLRIIVMREQGRIVGYNVFLVTTSLHYASTLFALNDLIYLAPAKRRGWAGVRLIRQSEKMLKELGGVVEIVYRSKPHVKLGARGGMLGDLLKALGYRLNEEAYGKIVGG